MGRGHSFKSLNTLKQINEETLHIIEEYLKTEKDEFRCDIDEYFNDKNYFSEKGIILNSNIIYNAVESMEFKINWCLLYFKSGESKYARITFVILSILKNYYGKDVLFSTDVDKCFLEDSIYILKNLGYNIKFEKTKDNEGEEIEEIIC